MNELFLQYCRTGELDKAINLYSTEKIYCLDEAFRVACSNERLQVAKWLYSLGINVNSESDFIFRCSCCFGRLRIAKWLYKLGVNIDMSINFIFATVCENGHLDVAKWLYKVYVIDIHNRHDKPFRTACSNGNLKIAKWLYSLKDVDINVFNDDCFRTACSKGYIHLAKWLYDIGGCKNDDVNRDVIIEDFITSCVANRLDMSKWLQFIFNIDVRVNDDICFKSSCENNSIRTSVWLSSLCNCYEIHIINGNVESYTINTLADVINKEIVTVHKETQSYDCLLCLDKCTDRIKLCDYEHPFCKQCALLMNCNKCLVCYQYIDINKVILYTTE